MLLGGGVVLGPVSQRFSSEATRCTPGRLTWTGWVEFRPTKYSCW
jgi:hypothetical protein